MTDEAMHGHLIGRNGSRRDLNTPVLVVDLDALEGNITRMAQWAAKQGLALRPHVKTHKSAQIARLQQKAGAIGFCCAKLGEAEVLADNGITNGLVLTSPVVSTPSIRRLIDLNRRTNGLMCVVDHPDNVKALGAAAARASGKPLQVLIDVDPGIHRTGVTSPEAAVRLFQEIASQPSLTYSGVQFYCGREQHIEAYADRRAAIQQKTEYLRTVIEALKHAGGSPPIITGGGTGTHRIDAELGSLSELQVGSYIFMDSQYAACEITPEEPPYEFALMVDVRVISANSPGIRTVDGGYKAFATDGGIPHVLAGMPTETEYVFMGDEHGALISNAESLPGISERIVLTAPHCDPTVNLYDFYHVVRGDTLVAIWRVDARGCSR
jgi:3-hydroxy-D-aspartate aldolase